MGTPSLDRAVTVHIKVIPEAGPTTRGSQLTVHLTCFAILYPVFRNRRGCQRLASAREDASFDAVLSFADACRDAVRRMLERFPYLNPAERDAVLRISGEGVPEAIVHAMRRCGGDTFRAEVRVETFYLPHTEGLNLNLMETPGELDKSLQHN